VAVLSLPTAQKLRRFSLDDDEKSLICLLKVAGNRPKSTCRIAEGVSLLTGHEKRPNRIAVLQLKEAAMLLAEKQPA
jgi:hypothetical protein